MTPGSEMAPDDRGRHDVRRMAATIADAHRAGELLEPARVLGPIPLSTAYEVQAWGLHLRRESGERLVGWKIGYTSAAMRGQMSVDAPNYGPLTDRMLLHSGDSVSAALVQPRVEPEVLAVMGADLRDPPTFDEVVCAVREARAALEVVDSVWRDYRFRLEDNTADGSSAAHAVIGPAFSPGTDLAAVAVSLTAPGGQRLEATSAAAMGHPWEAVRWLATSLLKAGHWLRAGDLVLSGGLTAAVPLPVGGAVTAQFGCPGPAAIEVAVRRDG